MKVKITDFDIVTHKQDSMWDRVGCSLLRKKKFLNKQKIYAQVIRCTWLIIKLPWSKKDEAGYFAICNKFNLGLKDISAQVLKVFSV